MCHTLQSCLIKQSLLSLLTKMSFILWTRPNFANAEDNSELVNSLIRQCICIYLQKTYNIITNYNIYFIDCFQPGILTVAVCVTFIGTCLLAIFVCCVLWVICMKKNFHQMPYVTLKDKYKYFSKKESVLI